MESGMNKSKLFCSFLVAVFALTFSQSVMALDLKSARSQGIIAEQADGYVKVVKSSPEATQLASEVNSARKQEYQRISKENGQPVDVVGKIAAQEIARKMKAGE
jgi:uncharacterized protein YdbL (DUF1318 family)